MQRPGVYLIGSGPGDPSLISVRGLRCLSAANVVVYEHPLHQRLLHSVHPEAEQIDVGSGSPYLFEQNTICQLLAEKFHEGKTVARLTYGDPFAFGNGSNEALFLNAQGIPFEIIPGIPPGVGISCYAGIPVLYPDLGDTVLFIRGYEGEASKFPGVDWKLLASLQSTIVCYANSEQLSDIVDALLSNGRTPNEQVVLVYNGTLPDQQTIHCTLHEISKLVRKKCPQIPALLIVGPVTGLGKQLQWFDRRPLFGKRIVVTRSRKQAGELINLLVELGADPVESPTVKIVPPEDFGPLDRVCAQIETFHTIVFTSANGVDYFLQRLLIGPGDIRKLKGIRLCAIGPATAEQLTRLGIKVDLMPTNYRAEAVVNALQSHGNLSGCRVLLPRANLARELLASELRLAGCEVVEVTAYQTLLERPGQHNGRDVYKMLLNEEIDAVTFASASSVHNFIKILGGAPAVELLQKPAVASIGPVTAEAAERVGIKTTIMPSTYTIPALVQAIAEYFQGMEISDDPKKKRGSL